MNVLNIYYMPHTVPRADRTVMDKTTGLPSWSWHWGEGEVFTFWKGDQVIYCDLTINGSHVKWHRSPPDPNMSGFGCFFESKKTSRGISGNPRHQFIITQIREPWAEDTLSCWTEKGEAVRWGGRRTVVGTTWMNLKNITLSERSQSQKITYCVIPLC